LHLHTFPTRRSSDLRKPRLVDEEAAHQARSFDGCGCAMNQLDRRSGALLDTRERSTGDRHPLQRSVSSRNCISECHERRSAVSLYTMPPSLLLASGFVNEWTVWPYACSCQSAPAAVNSLAIASTSSGGASGSS